MLIWLVGLLTAAAFLSLGVLLGQREQDLQTDRAAKLTDEEIGFERKRRAKRLNERLKLISAFSSGLGVAFVATSVLAPLAAGKKLTGYDALLAVLIALILHAIGQAVLHFWKSED